MQPQAKQQFDMQFASDKDRELMIDRQNAEAMKRLQGQIPGAAKPVPLAHKRRKQ